MEGKNSPCFGFHGHDYVHDEDELDVGLLDDGPVHRPDRQEPPVALGCEPEEMAQNL